MKELRVDCDAPELPALASKMEPNVKWVCPVVIAFNYPLGADVSQGVRVGTDGHR